MLPNQFIFTEWATSREAAVSEPMLKKIYKYS